MFVTWELLFLFVNTIIGTAGLVIALINCIDNHNNKKK